MSKKRTFTYWKSPEGIVHEVGNDCVDTVIKMGFTQTTLTEYLDQKMAELKRQNNSQKIHPNLLTIAWKYGIIKA